MANLTYISPFFIVTTLQTSVSFYTDKLGFELRFIGPKGDPYFAIVGRESISIMLKEIIPGIDPIPNHTRHGWARWDAFIYAMDPDGLFEEYKAKGLEFHAEIDNNDDGLRGFEVKDADGYVLYLGRVIPQTTV
jgi:catechol 2,3-dioxygenase-like lactoylglutathione lyase family enzyme